MMDHLPHKEFPQEFSTDATKILFDPVSLDAIATSLQQTKESWLKTQSELHQTQTNLAEATSELQRLHQILAEERENYAAMSAKLEMAVEQEKVAELTDTIARLNQELTFQQSQNSILEAKVALQLDQMRSRGRVRSKLLNELHKQNSHLRHQNDTLSQQTEKLQARVNLVTERLKLRKAEFAEALAHLEHTLEASQQEVARLQVGREALKEVFKSFLRRTKLGMMLFPEKFKVALNETSQDTTTPVTPIEDSHTQSSVHLKDHSSASFEPSIDSSNNQEVTTVQDNLASNLVEDVVMLRGTSSLSIEINPEILELLSEIRLEPRNILCIRPSKKLVSLAQSFNLRQHHITCVDCAPEFLKDFVLSDIIATTDSLLHWMVNTDCSSLLTFDLILIGQIPWQEINSMCSGRISHKAKLITHKLLGCENTQAIDTDVATWIQSALCHEELYFYRTVPQIWHSFSDGNLDNDECRQWPWNYPSITYAQTLPSGKPWPKISVVTVTLNQGEYLEETIRSILMQGYPNLEYIVLDGCSTDNTSSILNRYRNEITHCIIEPDKGQSDALNKGFRRATGDILAWLNSDDCYLPGSLFRVAIAFDVYQSDMVVGGCQLRQGFNPVPFRTHHTALPIGQVVPLPIDRLLDLDNCWQKGEFFYQPEVFWTRDLWQRSGGKVEENLFYSMDYELWVRMAYNNARVVHVPDPFTLFRLHEEQKTHGDDIPFLPELSSVCARYQQKLQE